jgi:ABC-type multidrug transport system ATPase subunit/pSer/pThr/pTyr-binding forkhead associated (FHA) protein
MGIARESHTLGTLRFLSGPLAGTTYPINKTMITLGRDTNNDIVVSDPSVSRQHAQLIWNNGSWIIKKLATQNTLSLNQRDISQSPLNDRDTVGLGAGSTFIFQIEAAAQPSNSGFARPVQGQPSYPSIAPQPSPQPSQPSFPNYSGAYAASGPQQPMILPVQPQYAAQDNASTQSAYRGEVDQGMGTQRAGTTDIHQGGPVQPSIPSLEVSTNTDYDKQVYPLPPNRQVFDIGRDPSNTIVINRPTVSGFHAQIVREGNDLVLIHPHPKKGRTLNGITYQGRTVRDNESFRHVLRRGDVFRISDEHGTFVSLTYNDGSGQAQEMLPAIRPIPLGAPVITIGRAPDNNVVLNHPQVSGHHARLERTPNGYRLIDQRSTNHTFVNAKRVSTHDLRPGDEIHIGAFKLTYTGNELTQQDETEGIRIDAFHLVRRGTNNVVLLNDISFAIPPRKFVALVGGSGAGKSTLMNSLNGYKPADEGTVLYNGQDYYKQLAAYSTQLGYVPQDDIIHRDLTVERALYYSAELRLPKDFTDEQIRERIDEVLEDVEMTHRRKLLISQLSGGQRKRVSIALELLAKPAVFFLDEPTSGLDPGLDRKMMLLLRKLADKGHTIVLVTHATNNINTCDYVCFLCQGGRLAYFGPPDGAKAYFGKSDFAEIYSALEPTDENPNVPAEAEAKFRQSPDYGRYVIEPLQQGQTGQTQTAAPGTPTKITRGNPWEQFFLLSRRYIELILNDRVNLIILLLQAPVIAIILFLMTSTDTFSSTSIATCFAPANLATMTGPTKSYNCKEIVAMLQTPQGQAFAAQQGKTVDELLNQSIGLGAGGSAQKILFIMAFAAVMFGCLNGSREIVKEAAIYKRERAVNLGISPYLMSKIVVLGIFSLVQSLILVALLHFRSPLGQTPSILLPAFIEIYITMALTSLAGLMTGLLISAIVPNNDRAMSLVPLPLIPQVIFAGVVFNLDNPIFLQIPGAFFSVRWAMAAMGSTIGLHGDKLSADAFSYLSLNFVSVDVTGAQRLAAVSHLLLCWGVLILMTVVQAILIAWFLKRRDIRK